MEQSRQAGRHVVDKNSQSDIQFVRGIHRLIDRQRCMGGWMDEWTVGWVEEWVNKWKGRKTERQKNDKRMTSRHTKYRQTDRHVNHKLA